MSKINADIEKWNVEDAQFWEQEGKHIAKMGFAVWMMWGMITTQMQNLGFSFTVNQLFSLTALAGLAGATLRIPYRLDEPRHAVLGFPGVGTTFRYRRW